MFNLPGYTIAEQLYESAYSLIYRARRDADGLAVVLKILKKEYPTPEELARFRREYAITRQLSGIDGVIKAYNLETSDHTFVMVLEDISGRSLRGMQPEQSLSLDTFLVLAIGIADVLGHIHQRQIMHKDMNPANIIWNPETGQVRLIDFGIATEFPLEQPALKNPIGLEGTLAYMSPEQTGRMNRLMDYRTDLYSCGATLYHLLTGQLPFQAEDTMEMVYCHLAKMPAPPSTIIHHSPFTIHHSQLSILSNIIMKLLSKNAEDRYQSAFGLKADLEYCLKNLTGLKNRSGFTPGQWDVSERFQIPSKLYGRAPEIQRLLQTFTQVATTGQSSLLLVTGYAGIGKSAIVNEIHLPITAQHGYFSAGKFDQLKRDIPYFAFIQAFQAFIRQILTEPEEQMRCWQEAFLKALAPNGQVIVRVLPEIELIIGPQPDVPALPPNQEQHRFHFVFRNFVRTCAASQHPLVLFLDDLQWADLPSLQLLELLLTDTEMNSLLIIGAYRDNEVDDAHPVILKLKELQEAGVTVNTIVLKPLTLEHVRHLLADTLHIILPFHEADRGNDSRCEAAYFPPGRGKGWVPKSEASADLATHPQPHTHQAKKTPPPSSPRKRGDARSQHQDVGERPPGPLPPACGGIEGGKILSLMRMPPQPLPGGEFTATPDQIPLQDSFQDGQELLSFAELCFHKTGGNPFFLRQFLQTLAAEDFLKFAPHRRMWQWNLANIQQAEFTENVIDFMAGKIRHLPENARQVITLAACIGNQFDVQTLALIHEHSLAATLDHLREALRAELILPVDEAHFKFLHDRVQQAAYSLLNEADLPALHLKIGRLLRVNTPESDHAERLFEMLNHLNLGRVLLTTQAERDELAALNLTAGKRAKTSAAYQAAYAYFQHGLELTGPESWQQQYDLTLALHIEAAEAAYFTGNFDTMARLVAIVLAKARTLLDQIKAHQITIDAHIAQNKLREAVHYALPVLKLLGVSLPEKPGKLRLLSYIFMTRLAFVGKSIEQLSNLPEMTDPHKLAALRIMLRIVPAAQTTLSGLFLLLLCKLAMLSRRYMTPASAYGYAAYGCVLAEFMGDFDSAECFGQYALQVLERFGNKEFAARTIMAVHGFVRPWKVHLRETLPGLLKAYHVGLETGDLSYASVSAMSYFFHAYFAGHPLAELERDMRTYGQVIDQLKQSTIHQYHEILRQTVLNLRQTPDSARLRQNSEQPKNPAPWRLVGEAYNEDHKLPRHEQMEDWAALEFVYTQKMFLAYLFQAYTEAAEFLERLRSYSGLEPGMLRNFQTFYAALIRLARFPQVKRAEQQQILKMVAASQKKLKKLARYAPMNRLHQLYLVTAERARVLGRDADAIEYYDKAITCAKEHGYLHEEALAHELAARYYLSRGKTTIAYSYLHDAHYSYVMWGAHAKAAQLEQCYPQLFEKGLFAQSSPDRDIPPLSTDTMTVTASATAVDLAAIMKTSQLLSQEIHLEKLFELMMRIILENAGAEKGVFIEQIEAQLYIQAEGIDGAITHILHAQPTANSDKIPAAIINYVMRSKQPLVLDNAATHPDYAADAYIQRQQPKSVLCFPALSQNEVRALLYLENNLTSGAFTPERVETLTLLSSQVAISLENARLYDTLEAKVKKRTQALEQEIAERKQAQEAAQEAQRAAEQANRTKSSFVANMSHELRTPLTGILGYTQLFQQDQSFTEEQRFGVEVIHRSGEHLLRLIDEVLDFSKIEARKMTLNPSACALPEFLYNVVEMARISAVQKGLTLSAEIENDLPAVVSADEQRLRQVLLNLLSNAIKFTEMGSVTAAGEGGRRKA